MPLAEIDVCSRSGLKMSNRDITLGMLALIVAASTSAGSARAFGQTLPADEFFEKQVRPVLVEHCHGCHGAKKQEMGLRLDSASGLRDGSESGPVVVIGDPDKSRLIEVVRYAGDTKMPPQGKLPAQAIETLVTWVKAGVKWPAEVAPSKSVQMSPSERIKTHWAFQPIGSPRVVTDLSGRKTNATAWAVTPLDTFILRKLDAVGLRPSPRADQRTLIRRATFDLVGLPPTPDEVAVFEADPSPDAFERLVERLLNSPRYGERWGRHWLDVARYADTKGYVRLSENPNYPAAWTYRDYVIRALNEDLPYDRFVLEQMAADQLDLGEDPRPLAAMGFLTVGQRFINSRNDIIDDQIDVVTRGLLGLTVTCARCHDHKFDPIPTGDYYGLHGVFASSIEPRVPPVAVPRSQQARFAPYLVELQKRTDKLDEFLRARHAELTASFRSRAGDYLFAARNEAVQPNFLAVMFLVDSKKDLNPVMVQRWARFLAQSRKRHDNVFAPWHEMAKLPADASFVARLSELIVKWRRHADRPERVNQVVVDALARDPPRNLAAAAQRYGELLQAAEAQWQQLRKVNSQAARLADDDWESLRQLLCAVNSPLHVSLADVDEFLFVDTNTQNQLQQQQRLIEDWIASPGAAPHAMALVDAPTVADSRVFVRGNASNLGEIAPRQFLIALAGEGRRPFQRGSGRLELARMIASQDNPLTARVIVNRVWLHHFGAGLVRTPSDFGTRGDPPTHPELLDHLSRQFMADGWSLKQLHRRIMSSATYQQQSARPTTILPEDTSNESTANQIDPENALLSRMNRRRLDWETLRDSLLAVSGEADGTMGGPAIDLFKPPFSTRRSVYGLIDRQNLPSALRTFDFVAPDATSPKRHQTTVPQQALFLLNSPLLKHCARSLAARRDVIGCLRTRQRIDLLHRLLFARPADPQEIAAGESYIQSAAAADAGASPQFLSAWEAYAQALLLSNEFIFID
jgi:hypothetical protein